MRKVRSQSELIAASRHLHYEWMMLEAIVDMLGESGLPENHRKYVLVEGLCLHTRNLRDFFFEPTKRAPQPDDVIADDFFAGKAWQGMLGAPPPVLADGRMVRIHKEVAHLTYARLDREPTKWEHREMRNAIGLLLERFLLEVSSALLHPVWKGAGIASIPDSAFPGVRSTASNTSTGLVHDARAVSTPSTNPPIKP